MFESWVQAFSFKLQLQIQLQFKKFRVEFNLELLNWGSELSMLEPGFEAPNSKFQNAGLKHPPKTYVESLSSNEPQGSNSDLCLEASQLPQSSFCWSRKDFSHTVCRHLRAASTKPKLLQTSVSKRDAKAESFDQPFGPSVFLSVLGKASQDSWISHPT